jgi:hypothetical protein
MDASRPLEHAGCRRDHVISRGAGQPLPRLLETIPVGVPQIDEHFLIVTSFAKNRPGGVFRAFRQSEYCSFATPDDHLQK